MGTKCLSSAALLHYERATTVAGKLQSNNMNGELDEFKCWASSWGEITLSRETLSFCCAF